MKVFLLTRSELDTDYQPRPLGVFTKKQSALDIIGEFDEIHNQR